MGIRVKFLRRTGLLPAVLILFSCLGDAPDTLQRDERHPRKLSLPAGLAYPPMPEDNPLTEEGIALGRRLFFDRMLSKNHAQACADCHIPSRAFTDTLQFSRGVDGRSGTRNTPGLFNAAWDTSLFWDGRAAGLEGQALEPVPNPLEMHLPWEEAVRRMSADSRYPARFRAAFGEEGVTLEKTVAALAQFERTLLSFDSKFDRFLRGEAELSPPESSGLALFNGDQGGCFHCHSGMLFNDLAFHNNGLDTAVDGAGRGAVTGNPADDGKFKTPTLRNIEVTSPYMHDGRFGSLEEVMEHYSSGGRPSRTVDPRVPGRTRFPLSERETRDIIAFLKTLTDSSALLNTEYGKKVENNP
jgi:cytochrome c peroxidase